MQGRGGVLVVGSFPACLTGFLMVSVVVELELPLRGLASDDDGCSVVFEEVFVSASSAFFFCI